MNTRYLLIVSGEAMSPDVDPAGQVELLGDVGLRECVSWGPAKLFLSTDTPTVSTPGGGLVLGHVFQRDGTPAADPLKMHLPLSPESIRSQLLEHCWGEYLLFQPSHDDPARLSITRDPSGGIPCVYALDRGTAFVTSDISLAARLNLCEKRVDWDALAHFLTYPYVKTERTSLACIRELLPGSTLHLEGTMSRTEQAWIPWDFVTSPRRQMKIHEAAAELCKVVGSTIRSWAHVDRSILVELSGGLDSSIVAGCLHGEDVRVACATLVPEFPGADERRYAEMASRAVGVKLIAEELQVAHARFDAPPPPTAVVPGAGPLQFAVDSIMQTIADREGLCSFYSGGGGDTVFGYLTSASPAADAFREAGIVGGIRAVCELSEMHQCTYWDAARLTLRKLSSAHAPAHPATADLMNRDAMVGAPDRHPWCDAPPDALPGDRERVNGLAGTQVFRDGLTRGQARPLRLPLLSQPVMETCLSIPSWMWIKGGRDRSVARSAFEGMLPEDILRRRSKGNFMQYNGAVYRQNKDRMRDYLMEGVLQSHHLLDRTALTNFLKQPSSPRDRSFMRMFDLCRAESWARHQC